MSAHGLLEAQTHRSPSATQPIDSLRSYSVRTALLKRSWTIAFRKLFARATEARPFADRGTFLHWLAIEQKRSERSGTPFMLLLIRLEESAGAVIRPQQSAALQRALVSAIRDTDIAGWHDAEKTTAGILVTEIVNPTELVAPTILKRITTALAQENRLQSAAVEITCHIFSDRARCLETFEAVVVDSDVVLCQKETIDALVS